MVQLFIDGASFGNPGKSGAAAVCYDNRNNYMWTESQCLGNTTTNNVAEYFGLLLGLRRIIRENRLTQELEVKVKSDSELLVKQMNGQYRVNDPRLKALYFTAQCIITKFARVEFQHIPRDQNTIADKYAKAAVNADFSEHCTIYYPNLAFATLASVEGDKRWVACSNDILAAAPAERMMIDAAFLLSMPNGVKYFKKMKDPHPKSVMTGKASSNILGVLDNLPIALHPPNGRKIVNITFRNVFVIDYLPVPMHLAFQSRAKELLTGSISFGNYNEKKPRFCADAFPESYRNHPYWKDDSPSVLFI